MEAYAPSLLFEKCQGTLSWSFAVISLPYVCLESAHQTYNRMDFSEAADSLWTGAWLPGLLNDFGRIPHCHLEMAPFPAPIPHGWFALWYRLELRGVGRVGEVLESNMKTQPSKPMRKSQVW